MPLAALDWLEFGLGVGTWEGKVTGTLVGGLRLLGKQISLIPW